MISGRKKPDLSRSGRAYAFNYDPSVQVRRFEDFLCKSDHSSYATCCIVDYDEGHEAHPQTGTSRPLPDFWRSDCQSHEYRIKVAKIDWERQIELRKEGKGSQTHVDNSLLYFEESERRYQQHIRTEHRK